MDPEVSPAAETNQSVAPSTPAPSSPTSPLPAAEIGCVTIEPIRRGDETIDWRATQTKLEDAYAGFPPDPESGAPAWNAAYNTLWAQETERAIAARMEAVEERSVLPGTSVAELVAGATGSPGYIYDADLARLHPCTRINLGPDRAPLVYAKGIIGALDEEQVATYCTEFIEKEASPAQQARLTAFSDASRSCSVATKDAPANDHLSLYFSCIGKELREKGVEA